MPEEAEAVEIPDYWEQRGRNVAQSRLDAAIEEKGYMAAIMDAPEGSPEAQMIAEGAPMPNPVIPLVNMPFIDPSGNPVDDKGNPTETPLERALRTNKV